jgi:hypothetical protein
MIAQKIITMAAQSGISLEELTIMVERAAITRLHGMNRRYHDWLFLVQGQDVLEMRHLDIPEVGLDIGEGHLIKSCVPCTGTGCVHCGGWGQVKFYNSKRKTRATMYQEAPR